MRCTPVRCAVQAISETTGLLPLHVYKRQPDGSKERASDHPLQTLLHDNPNEWTPAAQSRWRDRSRHCRLYVCNRGNLMRAGKLDREIIIETVTTTVDDAGTPVETWAPLATLRAELKDNASDETHNEQGDTTRQLVTFETRYVPGVTVAARIMYQGEPYNLLQVREIGRGRGLELKAVRLGP
jgi:SPP1 family predicted phage head-tail adaptor